MDSTVSLNPKKYLFEKFMKESVCANLVKHNYYHFKFVTSIKKESCKMSYETWDERNSFVIPCKHSFISLNPTLQIVSLKKNCRHFLWDQVPELNGDRFDEWYKNQWARMRCALAIKITNSFIHSSIDVGVLCQNCENLVQSYEKNRTAIFYHTFFTGELPSCLSCKTSDPHDYRPPYTCVHCCVLKFDVRPEIQEKFRNLLLPENRFLMKYGNTTLW